MRRRDRTPPVALPGGRCETGETAAEAAAREVLEECGLVVDAGDELARRVHPVTGADIVYVACVTRTPAAPLTPAPAEVDDVAWWPLADALAAMPDLYPPVREHLIAHLAWPARLPRWGGAHEPPRARAGRS